MATKKETIDEVKNRLLRAHGGIVLIKEETFIKIRNKACFVDIDFGEWSSRVDAVLAGQSHPKRAKLKRIKTNIEKYGVDNPLKNQTIRKKVSTTMRQKYGVDFYTQNPEMIMKSRQTCLEKYGVDNVSKNKNILNKICKSQGKNYCSYYWKTNEEIVCQGSWEKSVVDWLNVNKVNYSWKPGTFVTEIKSVKTGKYKTYNPDLLLLDSNTYIEIKGRFLDDAEEKWNWFHSRYPNSELWDEKKLKSLGVKAKW
jgi:hypothetical protein